MSVSTTHTTILSPNSNPPKGNTVTTNTVKISKHLDSTPTPPKKKPPFSPLVLATLAFMVLAVVLAISSAVFTLPALSILASVAAALSTTSGILSLRE